MNLTPYQMDGQYVPSNRIFWLAHIIDYIVNTSGVANITALTGQSAQNSLGLIFAQNWDNNKNSWPKNKILTSPISFNPTLPFAGNVASANSSALKYGLVDRNFNMTDFATKIVLSPLYSEKEVFLIYLSKQWATTNSGKNRNLLSVLHEMYCNNPSTCITNINNAGQNNDDILHDIFNTVTGGVYNPSVDIISPKSPDNIKHTLNLSGLLPSGSNDFSNDAKLILKLFFDNEAKLQTPHAHAQHLGSSTTGIFEIINKSNYKIFIKNYIYIVIDYISRNLIYYGAPGTGKSFAVDKMCKRFTHYRTTFHPDSDYSTFVGCYKPTKDQTHPIYGFDSVGNTVKAEDPKGTIVLRQEITYKFVAQAFTNAYVEAWQKFEKNEPVLLVIEEINRGNCAQIFGDLFQLLDRNKDGYSTYPIKPDADLGQYIKEEFAKAGLSSSAYPTVVSGEELILPNNLYIWATMNTSDQSLFPIDSAFKRRWNWKYVPITDAKEDWKLDAKDINGNYYDWYQFIQQMNKIIYKMTLSADKQMGYFFCKADENTKLISMDTFVNKVLFYLWNDVFKDFGMDEGDLFKYKKNGKDEDLVFTEFFDEDGNPNTDAAKAFIENVMAWGKEDKNE